MPLFYTSSGSGMPLVLLHGWGLNHRVWRSTSTYFSSCFHVHAVDLPGHGQSAMPENDYSIESTSEMLNSVIKQNSIVLAWSLGGLMAMQFAIQDSSKIKKLILVSSSPQFAASDDWPYGMAADVLAGFARELQQDYEATIQRFLSLQSMGSLRAKDEIRFLREALTKSVQTPNPEALVGGLRLLQTTNLRPRLNEIKCPTLIINGERDRLVKPDTGKAMSHTIPNAKHVLIKGAGHAPFISHPELFHGLIEKFIHE